MTTEITYREAINTIDLAIANFVDGVSLEDSTIQKITFAVNNDLQIRDYLIGLGNSYSLTLCAGFLDELATAVSTSERYAYDTVNAMYQYELENVRASNTLIEFALESNPDYNLTKLISRVLQAGWPSNTLTKMRTELASRVTEHILENSDYVIVEVA